VTTPLTVLGVSASLALCVSSGRRAGGLVRPIVLGRVGLPKERRGQETQRRREDSGPGPNQAASGNGAVAPRFHAVALWRAVPALQRSAEAARPLERNQL